MTGLEELYFDKKDKRYISLMGIPGVADILIRKVCHSMDVYHVT